MQLCVKEAFYVCFFYRPRHPADDFHTAFGSLEVSARNLVSCSFQQLCHYYMVTGIVLAFLKYFVIRFPCTHIHMYVPMSGQWR